MPILFLSKGLLLSLGSSRILVFRGEAILSTKTASDSEDSNKIYGKKATQKVNVVKANAAKAKKPWKASVAKVNAAKAKKPWKASVAKVNAVKVKSRKNVAVKCCLT